MSLDIDHYNNTQKTPLHLNGVFLKAVNPKTNCFVCMDMKLSNWDLLISIPIKVSIYIRLSEQLADT